MNITENTMAVKYQWALGDEFDSPRTVPIKKRNRKFRKAYSSKRFKTLTRKILKGFTVSFDPLIDKERVFSRAPPF